jgi:hypothetical protein
MIAQRHAFLARDNRFERNSLSLVRPLVNYYLALTVSLFDLVWEYANQCPIQACEWCVFLMTFNNRADVGEITISMSRGFVELTTAAHGTIAIVIGFALEQPFISHYANSPVDIVDICISPYVSM